MSEIINEIEELLSRNLFLAKDIKIQVMEADNQTQAEILPILRQMDEKQTDLFRKILEKNPHFFADLENMAIHEALKRIVEEEEKIRIKEISSAEQELDDMLSTL